MARFEAFPLVLIWLTIGQSDCRSTWGIPGIDIPAVKSDDAPALPEVGSFDLSKLLAEADTIHKLVESMHTDGFLNLNSQEDDQISFSLTTSESHEEDSDEYENPKHDNHQGPSHASHEVLTLPVDAVSEGDKSVEDVLTLPVNIASKGDKSVEVEVQKALPKKAKEIDQDEAKVDVEVTPAKLPVEPADTNDAKELAEMLERIRTTLESYEESSFDNMEFLTVFLLVIILCLCGIYIFYLKKYRDIVNQLVVDDVKSYDGKNIVLLVPRSDKTSEKSKAITMPAYIDIKTFQPY